MEGNNNDFHSLLATFQAATSDSSPKPTTPGSAKKTSFKKGSDSSYDVSSSAAWPRASATRSSPLHATLRKRIERQWRIVQIRRSIAVPSSSNILETNHQSFHLAICACVVDEMPQEHIWKRWMTEGNNTGDSTSIGRQVVKTSAELYVHAKFPEKICSEWVRSKTIDTSYRPNWNDVRIVRAMLALASTALKNPQTTHILFATESCIPILPLAEVARLLLLQQPGDGKETLCWNRSFLDAYSKSSSRCTRFDEQSCWDVLTTACGIPQEAIYKALPGWCLLCRKHIQAVLDLPTTLAATTADEGVVEELWPAFERVWAPEEVYFPTALCLLGLLPPDTMKDNNDVDLVILKATTWSKWDERARDERSRAHPLVYDTCFDNELVRIAVREGCAFLRKVKKPLNLSVWTQAVLHVDSRGISEGSFTGARHHNANRNQIRYTSNSFRRGTENARKRSERESENESSSFLDGKRRRGDETRRRREREDFDSWSRSGRQSTGGGRSSNPQTKQRQDR